VRLNGDEKTASWCDNKGRKVQSYTSRYFSKCHNNVSTQGSQETDLDIIKRGAIVLLHDAVQEYYCVLAVYAKHYNKYWLADANKKHKKGDTRLLVCRVKMLFNGSNESGRFEDIIPEDHLQAKRIFKMVKYADIHKTVAFFDEHSVVVAV